MKRAVIVNSAHFRWFLFHTLSNIKKGANTSPCWPDYENLSMICIAAKLNNHEVELGQFVQGMKMNTEAEWKIRTAVG